MEGSHGDSLQLRRHGALMSGNKNTKPIQCKRSPIARIAAFVYYVALSIMIASFFDSLIPSLLMIISFPLSMFVSFSFDYAVHIDGITIRFLWWEHYVAWEKITHVDEHRFSTVMYITNLDFFFSLLGKLAEFPVFGLRPSFRVTTHHSNYTVMRLTLQGHVPRKNK